MTSQTSMMKTFEKLNEAPFYHLYNLKNVKNTHGKVFLLVKLQAFSKSLANPNTLTRIFYKAKTTLKCLNLRSLIGIGIVKRMWRERLNNRQNTVCQKLTNWEFPVKAL